MKTLEIPAFAKINLTLTVTGKREDGYHLLESVFVCIDLCDHLKLSLVPLSEHYFAEHRNHVAKGVFSEDDFIGHDREAAAGEDSYVPEGAVLPEGSTCGEEGKTRRKHHELFDIERPGEGRKAFNNNNGGIACEPGEGVGGERRKILQKGLHLASNCGFPAEENIVTRADKALRKRFPDLPEIYAVLEKRIPSQAGLGGGSADCAAYLKGVNELCGLSLSDEELRAIGAKLGADVPFCLLGGAAIARGIGEELTPVVPAMKLHLLVVKPEIGFSTKDSYRMIDEFGDKIQQKFSTFAAAGALREGTVEKLCDSLYNVFEEVTDCPEIREAKALLKETGAKATLMTGSGSAVFGIYESREKALAAEQLLSGRIFAKVAESL